MLQNQLSLLYCRRKGQREAAANVCRYSALFKFSSMALTKNFGLCLTKPSRDACNRSVRTNMSVIAVVGTLRIEVIPVFPLWNESSEDVLCFVDRASGIPSKKSPQATLRGGI
jgi:hypothetical protein